MKLCMPGMLLSLCVSSAMAAASTDVLTWPAPTKPLKISEPVLAKDYTDRAAKVTGQLQPLPVGMPPTAGLFTVITPNSPLRSQGVLVGDWVVAIDNVPVMTGYKRSSAFGLGGPAQEWTVWSQKEQKIQTFPVGAGQRRQQFSPWINPAACFERLPKHDPRWAADLRVACAVWETDPALAFSALAQAERKGCAVGLLRVMACVLSYQGGAFEDAYGFGQFLAKDTPDDEAGIAHCMQYCAAICAGRFATAHDLLAQYNAKFAIDDEPKMAMLDRAVAAARALPEAIREPMSLAKIADQDQALTADLIDLPDSRNEKGDASQDFMRGVALKIDPPDQSSGYNILGPPGEDVDLTISVQLNNEGRKHSLAAQAYVMIVDRTSKAKILRIGLRPNGGVTCSCPDNDILTLPFRVQPIIESQGVHQLRMIVIGQRMEVLHQGRVIMRGPCVLPKAGRQLAFQIEAAEVKASFTDVHWRLIGKEPGVKKKNGADDF